LGKTAATEKVRQTVCDCLDRKVCNTLNTCCIPKDEVDRLMAPFLEGLQMAAERRNTNFKLHVARGSETHVPAELFERQVRVGRAEGEVSEAQAQLIDRDRLGQEWEWEDSPEVTLVVVEDIGEAISLFNAQSPKFVACLSSEDEAEHDRFWVGVNAPFVGDGFTRWVDGQYALKRPELGLSNWENGRLFGRGGVLSGDSVFTVRTRVTGTSTGKPSG
jgi:glutamate-5-semialdehyde dehydrogenase